ncbi:MAG TPA: hypothetical protein VFX85_07035 [Solirubrobacterales bacterium]|nr:hypothetical protein [Solirubrobacterales bacterium]
MTRFRICAVLLTLVLAAATLSACGGGEEDPRDVLDEVSFEGVESAAFDASVGVEASGKQSADVEVAASGKFERQGFDLPKVDATATVKGTANGEELDFEAGLKLLGSRGFVKYKGTEYEIDPSNYSLARVLFVPGAATEGNEGRNLELIACQEVLADNPIGELAVDPSNDGSADVNGEETTKISGELDGAALTKLFARLAGDPKCRIQLEAVSPLPLYELRQIGDELSGTVKKARIEIYVGDDKIIRKVVAELAATRKGGEAVAIDFELTLSDVNEPQQFGSPPAKSKQLFALFTLLGVNAQGFIQSNGGEVLNELLEKVAEDALS